MTSREGEPHLAEACLVAHALLLLVLSEDKNGMSTEKCNWTIAVAYE
jgi:hypothetical protein